MNRKILLKQQQRKKKPASGGGGDKDKEKADKPTSQPTPASERAPTPTSKPNPTPTPKPTPKPTPTTPTPSPLVANLLDIQLTSYERSANGYTARTQSLFLPVDLPNDSESNAILCMRLPPSPVRSTTSTSTSTECILSARTALLLKNLPSFGRAAPAAQFTSPPYTIKKSGLDGVGMFATRSLEVGDLILVERPLIIAPFTFSQFTTSSPPQAIQPLLNLRGPTAKEIPMNVIVEATLEVAYNRLSTASQEAYLTLCKMGGAEWGMLSIIWRGNMVELGVLGRLDAGEGGMLGYSAVCEKLSRVNHSCTPNVTHHFDPTTLTFHLRATCAIKPGDELVRAYIDPLQYTAVKKEEELKLRGFVCSCPSCSSQAPPPSSRNNKTNTTPSHEVIREQYHTLISLSLSGSLEDTPESYRSTYRTASALMQDMENAHLDGVSAYVEVMDLMVRAGLELGAGVGKAANAPLENEKENGVNGNSVNGNVNGRSPNGKEAKSAEDMRTTKEDKRMFNEAKKWEKVARRYRVAHGDEGDGGLGGVGSANGNGNGALDGLD